MLYIAIATVLISKSALGLNPDTEPRTIVAGPAEIAISTPRISKIVVHDEIRDTVAATAEEYLICGVHIRNISDKAKINYSPLNGSNWRAAERAQLLDNNDNQYKHVVASRIASRIVYQKEADSIYPGQHIADLLVFELPVESAEELRLVIPLECIGREGKAEFKIQMSVIEGTEAFRADQASKAMEAARKRSAAAEVRRKRQNSKLDVKISATTSSLGKVEPGHWRIEVTNRDHDDAPDVQVEVFENKRRIYNRKFKAIPAGGSKWFVLDRAQKPSLADVHVTLR